MKKILVFADYFLPGYKAGGPIRSIENFCLIAKNHFDIFILTRNNDFGEKEQFNDVVSDEWIYDENLNARIFYLSKKFRTIKTIKRLITQDDFDYIYLNSLYSRLFSFSVLWLAKIGKINNKIVLAPRGELNPGAREIKKYRKFLYIGFLKLFGFTKNITWHATNPMEESYIKQIFEIKNSVKLIADFPKQNQKKWQKTTKNPGKVKFIAISRISKIKNIEFIINLFNNFNESGEIILDIVGPIEDTLYYESCLSLVKNLGTNIKVKFIGQIEHYEIENLLTNYHFFISPTKGENFGHSIFEAMLLGKPVIISNMTPWTNLMVENIGWDIDLKNIGEWEKVIKMTINMDQSRYDELSLSAWTFAKNYLLKYDGIKELKDLFI